MSDDNLEDRVEQLEDKVEKAEKKIGWLEHLYNEIIDRLRSAGGQLGRAGKKGDDENKQP
jgi:chaperonin cofactor prefoldin